MLLLANGVSAQVADSKAQVAAIEDSTNVAPGSVGKDQKDIRDVFHKLTRKEQPLELYKAQAKDFELSIVPAAGYTLQTGFTIILAANAVFYTDKQDLSHASTILTSIAYTQYNQVILPLSVNLWTRNKKYNIISDVRYMSYPSLTYGLGPSTTLADGYQIDFSYLKVHQTVLRRINKNLFAGVGYYLDHFWHEKEVNPVSATTSFEDYGLFTHETASGICLQAQWDNRANQVNPTGGSYASMRYRVSPKSMGSTDNWTLGVLELRKFIRFPKNTRNIIALWNYNWMTFSGRPPYLLLPSTGWDDFFNTGRGYIQGRYRAKNMSYLEAEYRFDLLKNGLLGAVVFTNLQTFSNTISTEYRKLVPGGGGGLRIKLNKNSSTNLAIDYGFGVDGSRGFFINLGEVF